jgi:TatD DNase family protein
MYVDTHVHFGCDAAQAPAHELVRRAVAAGVTRMVAVGGSPAMNEAAIGAAAECPGSVRAAIGIDRHEAGRVAEASGGPAAAVAVLKQRIADLAAAGRPVAAIGELGLDFHYEPLTAAAQVQLFRTQLELAREMGLPVIVHSREADAETLSELRAHCAAWTGPAERIGVLHCYTGGEAFAAELVTLGFAISFSGIVTFRNADPLRAIAQQVPAGKLLIETDTPFLAPVPQRGQPNEPAFVIHVAACLARVRGCSADDIARLTAANAERLFGAWG